MIPGIPNEVCPVYACTTTTSFAASRCCCIPNFGLKQRSYERNILGDEALIVALLMPIR